MNTADNGARRENGLPTGWVWTTLGEILEVHYGKGLIASARNDAGSFPVYGSNGVVGYHDQALVIGPCIVIGRKGAAGAVHFSAADCWPIDTTYYAQPPGNLAIKYLYYLLGFLELGSLDRSTAIPGLNRNDLYAQQVPLAPVPEQHRIVDEIETQFTRLDAGVAALKRVQANLRRYKASVLKAACEGRLVPTEAELARAEGRPYEPADTLLQRILAERRVRWQQANPGKRYVEPKGVDTDGLAALPEGWVWARVEQAVDRIVDCLHSTPRFHDTGYYCVDTNCIEPGRIVFERIRFVDEPTFHDRNRRMVPKSGDVLFSREGALLGIAVQIPDNIELCLGQRMMVFRPSLDIASKYYEVFLNSLAFRSQYLPKITGTASPHLNIGDIKRCAVPVPPLAEQHRIVAEVERRLSLVDDVEATVAASLKRAERLRQSILKQAFEGRLVPQDANDEPASALLERIRAARAGVGA